MPSRWKLPLVPSWLHVTLVNAVEAAEEAGVQEQAPVEVVEVEKEEVQLVQPEELTARGAPSMPRV
jgi:hypothetical protein